MACLYVIEQGAEVTKQGNRLIVRKFGTELQSVPAFKVDQLILMGNIQITSQAIKFLLTEGIDTVFLTINGKYRGRLVSTFSKNIDLRRMQFKKLEENSFVLDLAKKFVWGKLSNYRILLRRYQKEIQKEEVEKAIHSLRRLIEKVADAPDLDSLRGIEGSGSALYFSALGHLLKSPEFRFEKRTRRPPRDPVNVLLSFGYTLLGNTIQSFIDLSGLDPYLGALHSPDYGRPSLALDLMEEFRPILVDTVMLRVVNTKAITMKDFYAPEDAPPLPEEGELEDIAPTDYPILLTYEGTKKWITMYEKRLEELVFYPPTEQRLTYRQICEQQVRLLIRHLKEEDYYQPFLMRM
ncbi:MAG: CRISPR-associated endonuclease Cas1 [Thermodesulfobacteriota bacterium]